MNLWTVCVVARASFATVKLKNRSCLDPSTNIFPSWQGSLSSSHPTAVFNLKVNQPSDVHRTAHNKSNLISLSFKIRPNLFSSTLLSSLSLKTQWASPLNFSGTGKLINEDNIKITAYCSSLSVFVMLVTAATRRLVYCRRYQEPRLWPDD